MGLNWDLILNRQQLEDRFSRGANDVLLNYQLVQDEYFPLPTYARDENNKPWIFVYGPNSDLTDLEWESIVNSDEVRLITHSFNPKATTVHDGYYSWPWADKNNPEDDHKARMEYFYRQYLSSQTEKNTKVGAVYPGFEAYYDQGYENGETYFVIDHKNGETLSEMVQMAIQYEDKGKQQLLRLWAYLYSSQHAPNCDLE